MVVRKKTRLTPNAPGIKFGELTRWKIPHEVMQDKLSDTIKRSTVFRDLSGAAERERKARALARKGVRAVYKKPSINPTTDPVALGIVAFFKKNSVVVNW